MTTHLIQRAPQRIDHHVALANIGLGQVWHDAPRRKLARRAELEDMARVGSAPGNYPVRRELTGQLRFGGMVVACHNLRTTDYLIVSMNVALLISFSVVMPIRTL